MLVGCGNKATPTSSVPTAEPPTVAPATEAPPPPTTAPGTGTCSVEQSLLQNYPVLQGLPEVTDQDWSRGPADASIELIEYSDFQ
jgi:hypothetical protein